MSDDDQIAERVAVESMIERDDGGPAFPQGHLDGPHVDPSGMTLRDWFAGQALAGVLGDFQIGCRGDKAMREMADDCYSLADAMMKARGK